MPVRKDYFLGFCAGKACQQQSVFCRKIDADKAISNEFCHLCRDANGPPDSIRSEIRRTTVERKKARNEVKNLRLWGWEKAREEKEDHLKEDSDE